MRLIIHVSTHTVFVLSYRSHRISFHESAQSAEEVWRHQSRFSAPPFFVAVRKIFRNTVRDSAQKDVRLMEGCSDNYKYVYICIHIYICIYIYILTRILGPPKAGHTNRHITLIILKSKCLKSMDSHFLDFCIF